MPGIQEEATSLAKNYPQLESIKTKWGFGSKDGQPPTPNATPNPDDFETITAEECLENFNKFMDNEKPGLRSFYDKEKLEKLSVNAADMVNKLREKKCGKETSKQLSILCLYDLVMLIGMKRIFIIHSSGYRYLRLC